MTARNALVSIGGIVQELPSGDTLNGTSGGGGSGTVTSVSVASANGFTGTVATDTTTPVITIATSVTGVLKGNGTAVSAAASGTDYSAGTSALATGIVKSTTSTGALTIAVAGDFPTLNQSTTGSAATLTTARTIGGVSFDGSANIVPQTIQSVNEASDTTCFPLFISASGSQSLQPLNNTGLTFNASNGTLGSTTFSGAGTSLTGTAASLTAGKATNIDAGVAGAIPYQTGVGATGFSAAGTTGQVLTSNGTSAPTWTSAGSGSVTTASVVTANGFAGTVATATTTPAITLTTSVTGLLKGNGTAISAASAGTDYLSPSGSGTALTGVELTANKDATGGYAGLTLFKINFKNAANTFTSFFTNANTAARTYTFPNKSMTVADDADVSTKQAGANNLTYFSALVGGTETIPYFTSSATMSQLSTTSLGQALLNSADAVTARTTLGEGTISTQNASSVTITGGTINGTSLGATTRATAQVTSLDANLDITISVAGKGLKVKSGSNAKIGQATLSAGTVTVSTTAVTANSSIFLTAASLGTVTVPTALAVTATTAGTSFVITSANAVDTSVVNWFIVERT